MQNVPCSRSRLAIPNSQGPPTTPHHFFFPLYQGDDQRGSDGVWPMCGGGTQIERWALAATQRFVCRAAGLSLLGSLCAVVDSSWLRTRYRARAAPPPYPHGPCRAGRRATCRRKGSALFPNSSQQVPQPCSCRCSTRQSARLYLCAECCCCCCCCAASVFLGSFAASIIPLCCAPFAALAGLPSLRLPPRRGAAWLGHGHVVWTYGLALWWCGVPAHDPLLDWMINCTVRADMF